MTSQGGFPVFRCIRTMGVELLEKLLKFRQIVLNRVKNNTGVGSMVSVRQANSHRIHFFEMSSRLRVGALQVWRHFHNVVGRLSNISQTIDDRTLRLAVTKKFGLCQSSDVRPYVLDRIMYVAHPVHNASCLVDHTG